MRGPSDSAIHRVQSIADGGHGRVDSVELGQKGGVLPNQSSKAQRGTPFSRPLVFGQRRRARSPVGLPRPAVHNGNELLSKESMHLPSGDALVLRDVLAIVLAGGRGTRLEPLTRDRAKPAVPFGGIYRIIDFTLSNCINSDLRKILVLTQYKAVSLNRHIDQGWKFLTRELDEYIEVIPPQQRIAEHWYQGTADAIYQNVYTIEKAAPRDTLILAGDHIYKMNYAEMIAFHRDRRADLTIACLPVPRRQAREFGVMDVDGAGRVVELPARSPGTRRRCPTTRRWRWPRWASTSSPPT